MHLGANVRCFSSKWTLRLEKKTASKCCPSRPFDSGLDMGMARLKNGMPNGSHVWLFLA